MLSVIRISSRSWQRDHEHHDDGGHREGRASIPKLVLG